ncbi:energy transducer TonB [Fulvimonas sp. R45]|uniref:energy transducer TonB n=1 Tax=Fulvimonas sp. R45 TaxID=3045937 RepID=UPI00265E4D13|nr:energy transducer TonB [Fulvimonas sp. R45]MDO1528407.1 energy transducer TonB [Fulvimonas sp. R45]
MSSASLAVVHRARPEPARIAALSATLALNLSLLLVALRPQAPSVPRARAAHDTTLIDWISAPRPAPEPPAPPLPKPLPKPLPATPRVMPKPATPPVAAPTDEGRLAATPAPPAATPAPIGDAAPAPVEASLAYRAAPLRYPVQALRRHMQGTVLLRVLVDESGKPLDVRVARTSGYPLLDRSAREQVLAGWRFSPARVDGRAVRAWAQVPVSFALRGM